MKKWNIFVTLFLNVLLFTNVASASQGCCIPDSGLFIGLGGGYNSIQLDQALGLVGVSDVFDGGVLIAHGTARGPANPFHTTITTFSPQAQVGYYAHLNFCNCHRLLWGAKFIYSYLKTTATDSNIVSPQSGSFTTTGAAPVETFFTGRATIASAQVSVDHELLLIPFVGFDYHKGFAYLGVGPSVFSTKSRFYNVIGFADVNGVHLDVSGNPAHFASSTWIWGAAVQIGLTHYFDPTWSIDYNYTYAWTPNHTTNYQGRFSNFSAFVTSGLLLGDATQRLTVQTFSITVNKVFCI